jgi:hypothetical protein
LSNDDTNIYNTAIDNTFAGQRNISSRRKRVGNMAKRV